LHRCARIGSFGTPVVYLQIALSVTIALAASALAVAPHLESPKCAAAPFFPAFACIRLWFGRGRGTLVARSSLGGSLGLPTDVRIPSFPCSFRRSLGWSHGCFGWQQGVLAVTGGGSCALGHRSDHNQTAAATGPERQRKVVGMLAAFSHVISPSTPRVVAGPPVRPVIICRR
jgi:hypothetical protein